MYKWLGRVQLNIITWKWRFLQSLKYGRYYRCSNGYVLVYGYPNMHLLKRKWEKEKNYRHNHPSKHFLDSKTSKTSSIHVLMTSWRHFQGNNFLFSKRYNFSSFKRSWRCLGSEEIVMTCQNLFLIRTKEIITMSWRQVIILNLE